MRIGTATGEGRRTNASVPAEVTARGRATRAVAGGAFTLLETIVACAIFFMVAFAILELVTRSLVAAKSLQQREPDPGIILAALSLTNVFEEGSISGNYEDIAPGMYPGYRWEAFLQKSGAMASTRSMSSLTTSGNGRRTR